MCFFWEDYRRSRDKRDISKNAELFKVKEQKFVPLSSMVTPRTSMKTQLLPNGKVIIFGGFSIEQKGTPLTNSIELFDPDTQAFKEIGQLVAFGVIGTVLMPDNKILLANGGSLGKGSSLIMYDIGKNQSYFLGKTLHPRSSFKMIRLPNGKVLILGGKPKVSSAWQCGAVCVSIPVGILTAWAVIK
jgi:hypothetical protein